MGFATPDSAFGTLGANISVAGTTAHGYLPRADRLGGGSHAGGQAGPALVAGPTLTDAAYAARWRASAAGVRPESRPHSLVRWAWSA